MKILHILNDGPTKLSDDIISVQAKDHEVKIIDLSKGMLPMRVLLMTSLPVIRLYPGKEKAAEGPDETDLNVRLFLMNVFVADRIWL